MYSKFARMRFFVGVLAVLAVLAVFGSSAAWGWSHSTQVSVGVSPSAQTTSIAVNPRWRCFDSARIHLGTGLRHSVFIAQSVDLDTAEHDSIERGQVSTINSISPQIFALNAFVSADVRVLDWFEVGFNLDVGGVSVGASQTGRYSESGFDSVHRLTPAPWNVLRGNTRDLGTLNSEFFVNLPLQSTVDLRLGWSHFFAEMRTDTPLKDGARRFRTIRNLALMSIRLSAQ